MSAELLRVKTTVNAAVEKSGGAVSLMDGLSDKIASISQNIQNIGANQSVLNSKVFNDIVSLQKDIGYIRNDIGELNKYIKESRDLELANQQTVKTVLMELASMVDALSANYNALDKRIAELESKKAASVATTPAAVVAKNEFSANITSEELSKEGERLLASKEYNNAKKYFSALVARGYKPARNNYLLGEAEYFSENWSEAIINYKKSVKLYDKADYMPRLLYHTAISFDKIKDITSANQFYKLLKATYPDSKEARASPDRK
ncbi:MAG: hypothetical protein LBQ18_03195 [Campylobacteraceae bacterium]|nr:hypothetical protein [Campylobacteraceae bacterium]